MVTNKTPDKQKPIDYLLMNNGFPKLFLRNKPNPRWLIFLVDTFVVLLSVVFAYALRFNFQIPEKYISTWRIIIPVIIVIKCSLFVVFKLFAGSVRYSGLTDLLRVIAYNLTGLIILLSINVVFFLSRNFVLIPVSILLIDFIISSLGLIVIRLAVKFIYEQIRQGERCTTYTALVGSFEDALLMMRFLELDRKRIHKVVAIFNKDKKKSDFYLKGIPTYHLEKLPSILYNKGIETLVIQKGYLTPDQKLKVVDICLQEHIRVMTIPNLKISKNTPLSYFQLKDIKMEELLEREPIQLNLERISLSILNKTILITGAAGSIGSEIVKQIAGFGPKMMILIDQAESPMYEMEMDLKKHFPQIKYVPVVGDIRDHIHMDQIFSFYKPDIVYHAAAYKHVPLMEGNACEAFKTNVLGTVNLVQSALKHKVSKFVMISTDKAVNPTNVMGATKRLAEMYVQASQKLGQTRFITTRFGNVIGSNGSAVLLFKRQIEQGGPVTVTHPEVTRFFMTIPEACQLVLEASIAGKGGEIFVFDMGKRIKILDLAIKMIRLAGFIPNEDIKIVFTGLRPGEKLYEELIHDKENNLPTYHPKIMIAKTREIDYDYLYQELLGFKDLLMKRDAEGIVKKMKQLIPEYISNNSKYCEMDILPKTQSKISNKLS